MLKEQYLTESNIKDKTEEWMKECKRWKPFAPFKLNIGKAVLLVLDMQRIFLDENSHAFIPAGKTIIKNINKIIERFLVLKRPIIYTRHIFTDDSRNLMNKIWKDHIKETDFKSEIVDDIKKAGDILIKNHYSAFRDTNLHTILEKNKIEQVVVTGVMTHLCCDTTTRDAFMNGFEPFFVIDSVATYNEELHIGTLRALTHGFAVPVTSEEIVNWKPTMNEQ